LTQPTIQPTAEPGTQPQAQAQRRKFWMRWRVRTGYPVAVAYLFFATPTIRSLAFGAIYAFIGLLVRGAAAGHLHKDQVLAISGPYSRTRNPLYLGSAVLAVGFIIAGDSWTSGALVGAYFIVFYYAVMRNEEEDLRVRFGAVFEKYALIVPLFLPRIVNPAKLADLSDPQHPGEFSWAQFRRNREYQAIIGTIACIGIVALRMWVRMRFGY
jgi:protein-S-isoprenylcysteine O-methyltransferase Ste14